MWAFYVDPVFGFGILTWSLMILWAAWPAIVGWGGDGGPPHRPPSPPEPTDFHNFSLPGTA